MVAAAPRILVALLRLVGELPPSSRAITAATVGLTFSILVFLSRRLFLVKRRLLWRVRRKLILSYIFIGVIPSLLILGFFLLARRSSSGP